MTKIEISFWVHHGAFPDGKTTFQAFVADDSIYRAIQDIAFEHLNSSPPRRSHLHIQALDGDIHLQKILELLKTAGWCPYFGEDVPEELRSTHFWVRRFRHYEKGDRDKCDYLHVHRWTMSEALFDFDSVRDGLYCGKVKFAKWKARYGLTSLHCHSSPYFVNGELKLALEAENLKGLAFKPVLFDKPEKARGEFWQMTSTATMPPCLLPVLTIPSTPHPVLMYDDDGHFPQELVFEESAVRKIEPFDVALTRENICPLPNAWPYEFIVSQRFRQVAQKLKMSSVDLVPVRLK